LSPRIACCLALLAALQGAHALPAQAANSSLKAAVRSMRTAVAELDEKPESGERAVAAIQAMAAFDSKPCAVALLEVANKLVVMATPIIEKRRKGLANEGGSGRLKRTRYELQNIDDAAEALAATLAKLKSPDALTVMLTRLTDQASTLPLWLRLQLAARIAELPEANMDWREGGKKKSAETLIALMAAAKALGSKAGEQCGSWLAIQLTHKNADVRRQAIEALAVLA
jgi:hypothetical protein